MSSVTLLRPRRIHDQLPASLDDRIRYLERLQDLLQSDERATMFDHLYTNLSILDAKSASLLQFNSILMAVFAIFLTTASDAAPFWLSVEGIVLALISSSLLLDVVWVHWSDQSHMGSGETHAMTLLNVRRERTILYRCAWNLSKCALLAALAIVVSQSVSRVL